MHHDSEGHQPMITLNAAPAFIPSPPVSGVHIGPLFIHFYGIMYVIAITMAIYITRRRWAAVGGDRSLVSDVALWAVPVGIIGGRIYFDITTPFDMPHHWWGPFAVWQGGPWVWGRMPPGPPLGGWGGGRPGGGGGRVV